MIITRGKHKGLTAHLHQAANDWLSVDLTLADGTRKAEIVNPTSAEFTLEEIGWLWDHAGGSFTDEFQPIEEGDHYKLRRVKLRV